MSSPGTHSMNVYEFIFKISLQFFVLVMIGCSSQVTKHVCNHGLIYFSSKNSLNLDKIWIISSWTLNKEFAKYILILAMFEVTSYFSVE